MIAFWRDAFVLLQSLPSLTQREKNAIAFMQEAYNAKFFCLKVLFS